MPVLFLVFWLILNARFTLEALVIGILISILASVFTYRLTGLRFAQEKKAWAKAGRIVAYLVGLVFEVIKANIHMIALILSWEINIRPQIIFFDSPVRSDAAKVALGNSITLTPGTITVLMDDGKFGVHAIDGRFGDGIEDSVFVHRLKNIEGGVDRV